MEFKIPVEAQRETQAVETWIGGVVVAKIATQDDYNMAVDITREVKRRIKVLEEKRTAITKPINDGLKEVNSFFKTYIEKLQTFETSVKRVIGTWLTEQERIRLEAQRKAEAEARKERERLEAQARAQREKEEAARRAAEDARRRAQQATDEAERLQLENEAAKQEAKADGAALAADTKQAVATQVIAPQAEAVQKGKGVYTVEVWGARVKDKAEFVRWSLASNMLEYLTVNEGLLNKEAQATKGQRKWPGVEITHDVSTRMRT